jgi:hypothetical protein
MEMRYIDPYQLTDKVFESMCNNPHEGKIALNHQLEHEHFLRMIALAPSADVEPVVHGGWLYDGGSGKYFCSACDENALSFRKDTLYDEDLYEVCLTDYCPNCGAKMDEKVEKL